MCVCMVMSFHHMEAGCITPSSPDLHILHHPDHEKALTETRIIFLPVFNKGANNSEAVKSSHKYIFNSTKLDLYCVYNTK